MPDQTRRSAEKIQQANQQAARSQGDSGTYSDQPEAPQQGVSSIQGNSENKPAAPKPADSTADLPDIQPERVR